PGESYGSVLYPQFSGGGAFTSATSLGSRRYGGSGGGVIRLSAGELVLDGDLRANGSAGSGGHQAGAGGTVLIEAARLAGGGSIEAQGFEELHSGGGGGRVAIWADQLDGFAPQSQVSVRGGTSGNDQFPSSRGRGGSGTLFVRTASSIHGDLFLDAEELDGRPVGATPLPTVGEFLIGSVTPDVGSPTHAWVEPAASGAVFSVGVRGEWVRVGGVDYRILEEGSDRRSVLLENASGQISAGAEARGVYKFDTVTIAQGAFLQVMSVLEADSVLTPDGGRLETGETALDSFVVEAGSTVKIDGLLEVDELRVGGELRPDDGVQGLEIRANRVVVEATGLIDVSGHGFSFGTNDSGLRGLAPEGVVGSLISGSHGGFGASGTGDPGEIFGSVYRPRFSGGGAGYYNGGIGGGVIEIFAPEIVLEGELRSDGTPGSDGRRGGAGGTILLETDRLIGAGAIHARGSDAERSAGGGGRVAILAQELIGFDPGNQVSAAGGLQTYSSDMHRGGAGTIYVKTGASTFGDLVVDGQESGGLGMGETLL
ncbi:MAG: hypothetical protein AAF725_27160, partial [Acidobacteriota bacterium]